MVCVVVCLHRHCLLCHQAVALSQQVGHGTNCLFGQRRPEGISSAADCLFRQRRAMDLSFCVCRLLFGGAATGFNKRRSVSISAGLGQDSSFGQGQAVALFQREARAVKIHMHSTASGHNSRTL